jgi:hypothetical protein
MNSVCDSLLIDRYLYKSMGEGKLSPQVITMPTMSHGGSHGGEPVFSGTYEVMGEVSVLKLLG